MDPRPTNHVHDALEQDKSTIFRFTPFRLLDLPQEIQFRVYEKVLEDEAIQIETFEPSVSQMWARQFEPSYEYCGDEMFRFANISGRALRQSCRKVRNDVAMVSKRIRPTTVEILPHCDFESVIFWTCTVARFGGLKRHITKLVFHDLLPTSLVPSEARPERSWVKILNEFECLNHCEINVKWDMVIKGNVLKLLEKLTACNDDPPNKLEELCFHILLPYDPGEIAKTLARRNRREGRDEQIVVHGTCELRWKTNWDDKEELFYQVSLALSLL